MSDKWTEPEKTPEWFRALPLIGGDLLRRGAEIERRREALAREREALARAEAALYQDIYRSGLWQKPDMMAALKDIHPDAVPYLDDNLFTARKIKRSMDEVRELRRKRRPRGG